MKKLLILLMIIIIPICFLKFADNYFSKRSSIYIEKEVTTIISNSLSVSLNEPIQNCLFQKPIFFYQYDQEQNIKGIYIDSLVVNQILVTINHSLSEELSKKYLEEKIESIQIPLGSLIFKSVFANIGPNVKIKVLPISFYKTDIITNMKPYGINNALFEIYLNIKIDVDTVIPLKKNHVVFDTNILLASQIIKGEIPYYYYSGNGTIEALPQ